MQAPQQIIIFQKTKTRQEKRIGTPRKKILALAISGVVNQKNSMPPEEKKSPWRTALKYAGIGFVALIVLPCFLPRSAPAPIEGYVPAEFYRIEDGKSFRGLARVRAYRGYEEDIASSRNGDAIVQRYTGYRLDISAIVLRNGKTHPLLFETEEASYGQDVEALTEDSEWRITLLPATQENVSQYKPRIGQWPILFVK